MLDEPANGLDPEGVRWLRDFLRGFASEGRTVPVTSHVPPEVAQTVDQVLIISRGRLWSNRSPRELTARAGGAVRVRADLSRLACSRHWSASTWARRGPTVPCWSPAPIPNSR